VSDSHEPSYYEIALTNRQVIVAFVILLVCLIAAFFSGVWVGRESGYRAAEQMARNTPPVEEEEKEGRNLEELEFFESEQKPAAPEPAPTPETPPDESSTLAEDVGSEEAASPETPETPQDTEADEPDGEEDEPLSRRARRRQREAEEREARAKAGREPAPAPAPSPATTTAPAPAEPARTSGQVVIQVFSSPEKDQAERIRTQLVRGGQRAFLSPVEVAGRTMYRVRIGPFDSRGDAQKVAEQVRRGYKLDTWVTE
jgi:cell division protein FtsN